MAPPQLTYRQTSDSPVIYRVSADGVGVWVGSISEQTRHVHPISTHWTWGVDIMPLMSHGGGVPTGIADTFQDALQAFKDAFLRWHATVPLDVWKRKLKHKRAGAERWK